MSIHGHIPPFFRLGLCKKVTPRSALFFQTIRHPDEMPTNTFLYLLCYRAKITTTFRMFFYCMFPFLNHLFVQMYIPELTILITHCISPFYCFPENLYSHSSIFHMDGLLLP